MTLNSKSMVWILAAGLLTAGSAGAQPAGGMDYHHGMMGGAMGDDMSGGAMMLPMTIQRVAAKLQLNDSQQAALKQAEADALAARQTMRGNADKIRQAMDAEMAKNAPDFAAVARVGDGVKAENDALHKKVRDEWLALYATLNDAQKQTVRDEILAFRSHHGGQGHMKREEGK